MMLFLLGKTITFIFALCISIASAQELDCDGKLDDQLKRELLGNEDLFEEVYKLSQLKLARELASDEYQKEILGERIKDRLGSLDRWERESFQKQIVLAYRLHGKEITERKAKDFTDGLSVDLDQEVAAFLLRNMPSYMCSDNSCLGEDDEANLWMAGELDGELDSGERIELSFASHLNPQKVPEVYLKGGEGARALEGLEKQIDKSIEKMLAQFKTNEQVCGGLLNKQTCERPKIRSRLADQVGEMINVAALSRERTKFTIENPKQALDAVRAAYGWQAAIKREPASEVEYHDFEVNSCGGQPFTPSLENKDLFGFSDPRGSFKGAKDAWSTYRKDGLKGLEALNKKNSLRAKAGGKFNGASILNKFTIPGPMFRCEPENPIVVPKIGMLLADKNVCCEEKVQQGKLRYFFFNWGGGFSCRAFFGLPYLAEVGAKIGVGVNLILSGGVEPASCAEKTCIKASPMFNVSAGLYAEALAGAGSIQGTVSWMPFASIQQCMSPISPVMPEADLSYQIGRIVAIVNVRLGWSFSYSDVTPIYENDETKHTSFPIF